MVRRGIFQVTVRLTANCDVAYCLVMVETTPGVQSSGLETEYGK